jgi:hypothetical protein
MADFISSSRSYALYVNITHVLKQVIFALFLRFITKKKISKEIVDIWYKI